MSSDEEKPYRPSWEDDNKWTALLSPIRSTTANAEGVSSKIEFWKKCITAYCSFYGRATFTREEIEKAFTRNGRTPQCIPTIIEEMYKCGKIYNMTDFLKMKPTTKQEWSTWAWEVTKTPISWAWEKVKKTVYKESTSSKFIDKNTIQYKADVILKHTANVRGNVIQLGDIVALCNWPNSQDALEEALLAVHQLVLQKKAAVDSYDFNNLFKVLIKIGNVDEAQVSVSEKDVCKYNLSKQIEVIEAKIAQYDSKIDAAREEAKFQLRRNCKSLAMIQLKKKKRYESIINQQANVLNNLCGLLETVNQSEANIQISDTVKAANAAIKNMTRESNLNEDSVQEVMDDVRDTMEEQSDINDALSKSVLNEDNEEIEKELDALLKDQAAEDELCKFVETLKLPDVPAAASEIGRLVPEA